MESPARGALRRMANHNDRVATTRIIQRHRFKLEIRKALWPLYRLDNWHWAVAWLSDVGIICVAVWLFARSVAFAPLSMIVIGSRQRALASILHESCHRTLARDRALNDVVGRWLAGFPVFQSYDAYRKSHVVDHHGFLGDPERDPDYRQYIDSGLFEIRDRLDFVLHVLRVVLLLTVPRYVRYLFTHRLAAIRQKRGETLRLLLVQIAIATSLTLAVGPWGYPLLWLLPMLTAFQIIGWMSELAEHYPIIRNARSLLGMTRNRFPAWMERIFVGMHGDNYHQVHHLFPRIPHWNLARAHRVLLEDEAYRNANEHVGGILTARKNRQSVLSLVMSDLTNGALSNGGTR
jgi:fatty acid desaturase